MANSHSGTSASRFLAAQSSKPPSMGSGTLILPRTTPYGLALDLVNAARPDEVLYTWMVVTSGIPATASWAHRVARAVRVSIFLAAVVVCMIATHTQDSATALAAIGVMAAIRPT